MDYNVSFDSTFLEFDPVGEIEHDEDTYRSNTFFEVILIITVLLKVIVVFVAIAANIFLIYVIHSRKHLSTKINSYIKHYALANTLYFMAFPSYVILKFSYNAYCVIWSLETGAMFLFYFFVFGLSIEVYMTSRRGNSSSKCSILDNNSVLILYLMGLAFLIVNTLLCYLADVTHMYLSVAIAVILWLTCIVIPVFNFAVRKIVEERGSKKAMYALKISNFIMFSWLPLTSNNILWIIHSHIFDNYNTFSYILEGLEFIPCLIAYSSPILVVYILGRVNKHFKMAYDSIFRRKVKRYDNENIDEDTDEENGEGRDNVTYSGVKKAEDISVTLNE